MVTPSWGSFEKPKDYQETSVENEEAYPVEEFKQEEPGDLVDNIKPEPKQPRWGEFQSPTTYQGEPSPEEEDGLFSYYVRNITANASRLGEQFFGRYGNIEKFGKDIVSNFPSTTGVLGWAISELVGQDKWERIVRGKPGREQIFPTSENIKELSEKASKGYTSPKTTGEEKFQGYVEDIASTISRRSARNPTVRNIGMNNLLIPAASNVVKNIVEDTGFGKDKANLAKMAVWLPLSLAANVNASQFAANLMNQGRRGFGRNVVADVPRYEGRMNTVSRNLLQGDPRASLAQQQIAGIQNDIAQGQTSMSDLMVRYDAINAAKRDRGLFALNPGDRRAAIRNIDLVRDSVRSEIEAIGQVNPQALQSWRNGVMAFSTVHRSNALTNWVQGLARGPYAKLLTGPAAALFGLGGYGASTSPLIGLSGSAGAGAAYKTGQVLYRMHNNEQLARYYWNAISASQSENIPAFINNYNKLNKELEKSEPAKPKSQPKKQK